MVEVLSGWLICGAVLAGYVLGRTRPWHRLRAKAWFFIMFAEPGRAWKVKAVLALVVMADHAAIARWKERRGIAPQRRSPVPVTIRRPGAQEEPSDSE